MQCVLSPLLLSASHGLCAISLCEGFMSDCGGCGETGSDIADLLWTGFGGREDDHRECTGNDIIKALLLVLMSKGDFMRKLLIISGSILVGLFVASIGLIYSTPYIVPSLRRYEMATWLVAVWGVFGVLLTVAVALFGKDIWRTLHKPSLRFNVEKDRAHCHLIEDLQTVPGKIVRRVEIYGDVVNGTATPACNCQVATNKVLVSTNGASDYSLEKQFCTASFKWANSRTYEVSVRRALERYLKLVEIVEEEVDKQGGPDDKASKKKIRTVSMRVCVPSHGHATDVIEIGAGYKGIIFPVKLASDELVTDTCYVRIVWQGDSLKEYMHSDKLIVKKLSYDEALAFVADAAKGDLK